MKSNRIMIMAAAMAIGMADGMGKALEIDAADRRYDMDAAKRKAEDTAPRLHRPNGSTPVPGGGAKERARRLARKICDECGEHIGHCECHVTPA